MKKLLIAATVAAAFTGWNVQAASTGTITFNGELTETTCDVNLNKSGTANGTVNLPTIDTSTMTAAGDTAGDTLFSMELSNCTLANGMTQVAAYFQDNNGTVNTNGRLVNQSTATDVSNVTLELVDRSGTNPTGNSIVIGQDQSSSEHVVVDNNAATLEYSVRYYAESAAATAGEVSTSVVYALQYK